jgi:hypothetical protein
MNREMAVVIVSRIEGAFGHMNEAIRFLQTRLDEEDLEAFHGLWSPIVSELDLGVLEVIYRTFPDLRPEGIAPAPPLAAGEGREPEA